MKKIIFISFLAAVIAGFCFSTSGATDNEQAVNAIIGDISFQKKFGHAPDVINNERLRIKTHLEYVEKQLRRKKVAGLSSQLQQRRSQLLDFLHNYWEAGVFPRNFDYRNTRKPCFIDKDGRICAVGYLIEKTAGRKLAEDINSHHKYEKILAMNDKVVDEWIDASGLSKQECAMIQPAYSGGGLYPSPFTGITKDEGISSSVFTGANVSINTINLLQTIKGTSNKTVGIIGLVTGAGQIILGVDMFPDNNNGYYGTNSTNEGKKTLAMVNVGLGTATMLLSAWNLTSNKKPRYSKVSWNLNSFETPNNTLGMAITCKRRL